MGSLITDTSVVVHLNGAALNSVLKGEHGEVSTHTIERATRVQSEARIRCPVHTGKLRDSNVKRTIREPDGMLAVLVGSALPYAETVHNGSPAHWIRPRKAGGMLRFTSKAGQVVYARAVHHPGTKARPWLIEALRVDRV